MTENAEPSPNQAKRRERGLFSKFFQPWSSLLGGRVGQIVKAVVRGGAATCVLIGLIWTLFSTPKDLDNRSVASVLLRPNYLYVDDYRQVDDDLRGFNNLDRTCLSSSATKPDEGVRETGVAISPGVCIDWRPQNYWGPPWIADAYVIDPRTWSHTSGASRNMAFDFLLTWWFNLGLVLVKILGVLLCIQFGVGVGYSGLSRTPNKQNSDNSVTK
jgi:hypothetical protein